MGAVGTNSALERTGLWAVYAGCGLAMLPVYTAFLPVDLGIDPRLEPMPMALHAAGALCAFGLALTWLGSREQVGQVVRHPMVMFALAVALWSALVAPFADYPLLSMLGTTVFGEGAVRYAALGVFFAAALLMSRKCGTAAALHAFLAVGSFVAPVVMFLWGQAFFVSLDIVGPFALSGAVGGWLLAARAPAWARVLLAATAAAPGLALSSNHTAIATLLLVALPIAVICRLVCRSFPDRVRLVRLLLVFAIALAPLMGLAVKWLLPEIVAVPSILSRHLLDSVLLAGLVEHPSIVAIGQGWGAIALTFDSHLLAADAVLWNNSWDLTQRFVSHSHSIFSEALFGAGLPAVIGVWGMLAAPVLVAPARQLPLTAFAVLAYAGMGSFSGEFPATVGATALAIGLAADPLGDWSGGRMPAVAERLAALGLGVLGCLLALAAAWQFAHGEAIRARVQDVRENGIASLAACDLHPYSELYADMVLAQGLVRAYRPVFERLERGEVVAQADLDLVDAYLCSAEARMEASTSASFHLALEAFRTDVALASIGPEANRKFARALEEWPRKLTHVLNAAPLRSDIAKGFLAAHLQAGDLAAVSSLADAMLRRDPSDPVALWFLGLATLRDPLSARQAQGWHLLQRAIRAGVERVLPVPPETVEQVQRADRE